MNHYFGVISFVWWSVVILVKKQDFKVTDQELHR